MTHLRQRMQEDLRLRNFSERTIRHYTHTVAEFAKYFHKSPDQLGPEHVRTWLLYLLNERKLAWGTIQGARSALKFLYLRTLKQTWFDQEVIKPKVRRKLPTVWSREEICALLDATTNTKHRTLLALYYSAGLRCQEALDLKVTDIDSKRVANMLVEDYLRPAAAKAGILSSHRDDRGRLVEDDPRRFGFHNLRHSLASFLVRIRTDPKTVQTLLRHSDVKLTLQFYSHAVSQDRMTATGEMLIAILSHATDQSGLGAD